MRFLVNRTKFVIYQMRLLFRFYRRFIINAIREDENEQPLD